MKLKKLNALRNHATMIHGEKRTLNVIYMILDVHNVIVMINNPTFSKSFPKENFSVSTSIQKNVLLLWVCISEA